MSTATTTPVVVRRNADDLPFVAYHAVTGSSLVTLDDDAADSAKWLAEHGYEVTSWA